jgi:hypothetical protein
MILNGQNNYINNISLKVWQERHQHHAG